MSISNYAELALLNALFNNTSIAVAQPYAQLHIGSPGETGTSNVAAETDRVAVSFANAASGAVVSNDDTVWTSVAATESYSHISLWDASTAGNCLWYGPLGAGTKAVCTATSADTFTSYAHGYSDNDRIEVFAREGAGLPTGISEGTLYYVVSSATDTFQLSTSQGGGAVNLTSNGEAICQRVVLAPILIGQNFTIPSGQLTINLD